MEGIAKAGGGTSAFVTYNESIDKKVLNQLKNGLQPSLTGKSLVVEVYTVVSHIAGYQTKFMYIFNCRRGAGVGRSRYPQY